ncbi:class I SAM-dependent DNA methyltransferase [Streptomyces stackebrandtii]|uniref:class I SAM-dependent DNA methyltransferase n=1 Tax=Streptomyces stackebrandtii TaxID=3051177 RepID=UPI0028DC5217|nr:class I SAM-dependent DNA methyltransferase [Streptomyces sp. DSM 40976]
MTYDSLVNRGDYFSAHYLAEVLPKDLKTGLLQTWKQREEAARPPAGAGEATDTGEAVPADDRDTAHEDADKALPVTPRAGLRALRRDYFRARSFFALPEDAEGTASTPDTEDDSVTYGAPVWRERVHALNAEVLRALGYDAKAGTLTVERAGQSYEIPVAHAEKGLVAVDCGWAAEADAALDPDGPGRLLDPVALDGSNSLATGSKLASFLFACDDAPRYVLLLVGGVVVLADRMAWGEGRYLAVSLDTALQRNDTRPGGEIDTVAALFGADSLRTPEEGGENPLAELVGKSTKHAVGVSGELRDGLRLSVELIANEVLERLREQGVHPQEIGELAELGRQLTRESLRYLYRILFLLYAEARPELGILPSDYPEYQLGYGLGRLGDLVAERDLVDEKSRRGFYLYESLDLLFRKVQDGYRPRRTHGEAAEPAETADAVGSKTSEDLGLRFEPLHSTLFERDSIRLIGADTVTDPRHDADEALARGESVRYLDTRLRNATLYEVLHKLMLTKGRKGERGGFISYAQLGINQLGAVYEGLMSYSGFIAGEELYEVAKGGDPKDGSWLVPKSKSDEYPDSVFVRRPDRDTGEELRVGYAPGSFVYRLSGRDRQTSASYYTPESLTKVTVQLALQHRLDQDGAVTEARELLDWKICEPALGSGAFLNEAINQVAAEYLRRRQKELGRSIDTEQYAVELQKAKAYIALHNSYGVDLNETAVELAEVSLWLNTMHPGMEAPWFGLHLRRGNSLIGGRREVYGPERLKKGGWLGTTPERYPLTDAQAGVPLPDGAVHHFLLPAKEWGAVAAEKEARALAPEAAKALGSWRKAVTKSPTAKQTARLQGLARRAEYLWELVVQRLTISEREISRRVDVWEAEAGWLRSPKEAVSREKVLADLTAVDTPYWRLKKLMDAWCALWFWPVQEVGLLDGSDRRYERAETAPAQGGADAGAASDVIRTYEEVDLLGNVTVKEVKRGDIDKRRKGTRKGEQSFAGQRREVIPLAELDDWLDFAEALLGTHDVPAESLVASFDSLGALEQYEDELPDWMGMDRSYWLESRFPWVGVASDVAGQQGFFHWELEFAQVFGGRGGFDLQVGNPPWVRPDWQENSVLAELEPWFMLSDKPGAEESRLRKSETLQTKENLHYLLSELTALLGVANYLSSLSTYPLLSRTRPDLYRAFMVQTWQNSTLAGVTGLIHPDTHFSGTKEGALREATYRHLRIHAHFSNRLQIFEEVQGTRQFSVNIYSYPRPANFTHVSWLFSPDTLTSSFSHDGSGPLPGIKYAGGWETRPHAARLLHVDIERLGEWNRLAGEGGERDAQAPLLYPVTSEEQGAISKLTEQTYRLAKHEKNPPSSGYNETNAKKDGLIKWATGDVDSAGDLILQGSHLLVGTPFAQNPKIPCRSPRDWLETPPQTLSAGHMPRVNYARACDSKTYRDAQDVWDGRRYTEYFRLTWRVMIDFDGNRSLFAALIPPGPAHVDAVNSMALKENRLTALNAGFWASLPLDYLLRITGRRHLRAADARKMPAPDPKHPLASALLLRSLRLNALTNAYAPLWEELFDPRWAAYEDWANPEWRELAPLATGLKPTWEYFTPLRTEYERRAALVELDALVSVWLGITADQLVALYRSRYPVLSDFELAMWFDSKGRKIAANHNTYGHGQTKQDYLDLLAHLENPDTAPSPSGYVAPFYKADREAEMRAAHAHFQARLDAEITLGRWTPPERKAAWENTA